MNYRVVFFPEFSGVNPYWTILASSLADLGVKVVGIGSIPFGRRWLWRNRHSVQILHFHYVQQFYAYEMTQARLRWVLRFASNLLLARLLGYKTVFTLHNATPTYPLQPERVDYLGHWFAANLTNGVIVHCEAARSLLQEKFGRCRQVFSVSHPNFIGQYPNAVTRSASREFLGQKSEDLVFAFIGGIRPNKGLEKLIAAFKQLEGAGISLIIAGKPWPPETYTEALEKAVMEDPRIILHKCFIPEDEFQIYFNAADVVVLPFERILTSSSVVLAMSFACPVIAPAMGCLPELITEDVGILYDSTSEMGLLQALNQCEEMRSELGRMGKRAQAAVANLTGKLMAEQTLIAYRESK